MCPRFGIDDNLKTRVMRTVMIFTMILLATSFTGCKKDKDPMLRYFEVGTGNQSPDWRDSSFVVATSDETLIRQIEAQLQLPVNERKIVIGKLERGSGGYNKNSSHEFKWHFREDDWNLTDLSIEIYDGRPYSDLDLNIDYWIDTVKRFSPWSSYLKRELGK
jgi:hypothetical protein